MVDDRRVDCRSSECPVSVLGPGGDSAGVQADIGKWIFPQTPGDATPRIPVEITADREDWIVAMLVRQFAEVRRGQLPEDFPSWNRSILFLG